MNYFLTKSDKLSQNKQKSDELSQNLLKSDKIDQKNLILSEIEQNRPKIDRKSSENERK